ncbi:hypothetical protein [Sulfurivirga sp.]|uniref:hypothetical protein n=1 Tax=Sulfurivirga sp. TaxID=2614236 RepID=UPI0025D0011F|nr:hypothetical protein [Sulfurivirga sp.]
MSRFREGIRYLYGRRMVLATADDALAQVLTDFLDRYGVQVTRLNSVAAVGEEIRRRLYGTRRIYLAILIDAPLAENMLEGWRQALAINPVLADTPVAVLAPENQQAFWRQVDEVRHVLPLPLSPRAMLRWLAAISRWRQFVHELEGRGEPPARLSR